MMILKSAFRVFSQINQLFFSEEGLDSHLVQLVEVGRHQTDQLTCGDLIQDFAGELQGLEGEKSGIRKGTNVKANWIMRNL